MALGQLLHALGLGGSVVLVLSAILAVYHIREIMQAVGRLRTWVMAVSLFGLVLVLGAAGFIPGLDVALGKLVGWLSTVIGGGFSMLWELLTGWLM